MLKAISIYSTMLITLFAGCEKEHISMKTYAADSFSLLIPRDTEVTKKTPVEDFDIYELKYKGNTILYVYVGNHPSFVTDIESLKGRTEESNTHTGYSMRSVRNQTSKGTMSRHVLLDISTRQNDWPQFIHFWYSDLAPDMANISDEIIASTEIQKNEKGETKNTEKEN